MSKKVILFLVLAVCAVSIIWPVAMTSFKRAAAAESGKVLKNTWNGYKKYFIRADGRVIRPKEDDTVSEGQGYTMLRAVWMDDKDTFDRCYRWTENNLSRSREKGDSLLAWHWKDGKVADWMPASDADIDYALSLIFADSKWRAQAPAGLDDYGVKADKVLGDILRLETYFTGSGRLYLAPWILNGDQKTAPFPVNPSYYSPAHFRIFYEYSRDDRWKKLTDTAYYVLNDLSRSFNGVPGKGLIPDWCAVSDSDKFSVLEGKSGGSGWEAVRIPFRVGLDFVWFRSEEAKNFFDSGFSVFIEEEWAKNKAVYCEYDYNGTCSNRYENALFYAAYYFSLSISKSPYASEMLKKTRGYIVKNEDNWVYENTEEYFVNSLAWLAEGLNSGMLKDLARERNAHGK